MPLRTIVVALACLAAWPSHAAATYYVSPSGADGAGRAGDLSEPFATIQYAISRASAGDTIYLEAGATKAGIAFMADDANHEYVRVDNVDISGFKDGIVLYGFDIDGGAWQPIASGQAQSGSVSWEAPNVDTDALLVRARGTGTGDPTDQSGACSVAAIVDSDDDRIDDTWEMNTFGDLTTADGTTDADGDGASDREEFWAGSDALVPPDSGGGLSCGIDPRPSEQAAGLALLLVAMVVTTQRRRSRDGWPGGDRETTS